MGKIEVKNEEELQQVIAGFHPLDQCIARYHFKEYGKVFLNDNGKPIADAEALQIAAGMDAEKEKRDVEHASAKYFVDKEIQSNKLESLFSPEMLDEAYLNCYRNIYKYDMDDDYAARDAVGNALLEAGVEIPKNYDLWVA